MAIGTRYQQATPLPTGKSPHAVGKRYAPKPKRGPTAGKSDLAAGFTVGSGRSMKRGRKGR